MQKKIKYYETVSAANISLYANLLANVLFQFRGGLPKIEDDYKYFTDGFKTLTISQETGELDFENSYLLHNPKLFSQELPKNKQEALKICRKFFIDRTEKLQANEKLRQLGLAGLLRHLRFDNAFAVELKNKENEYHRPRIDHWECHFQMYLSLGNREQEMPVQDTSLIMKIGHFGKVIAFHYHLLPIRSEKEVYRVEGTQTEILTTYQDKIKTLQSNQSEFLNSVLDLFDRVKEVQASVDKVYETFKENHLTVENFLDKRINETLTKLSKELWSKADGYGMTYKVPTLLQNHEVYLLDDKTKDLYSPEADRVNLKINYLRDIDRNLILPYYEMIDSNTFEKIWISATKYGINKVQTDIVKLVITTEITGYTLQFIYGDLEEVIDYNKTIVVPTYSMKILKNGTEVEQDFHITRDGWYSRGIIDEGFFFDDVQLTNRHFEPRDGDVNLYSTIPLEYPPDSDLEAYTLTQCGKRGLEAEPITEEMNTRIEEEFNDARKNLGIARGIMIHIGGFYYNAHYQQNKLAGSYGCFGFIPKHQIFNTKEKAEECRVNGSYTNWEVSNKDYNEYMAKVIKLKGKGALVRVVIQKRKTVEKLRILKNQ